MDKNLEYIKSVTADEIDWTKLFGSYSCGRKIGEEIKKGNLLDLKVLKNIEYEIEHQSTLWTLTPFTMIFIARELEKEHKNKKEEFHYLLEIFNLIAETLKFTKEIFLDKNSFDKLKIYSDMKEIFNTDLNLEDFEDEEEYIEIYFENEMSDEKYNSSVYYTNLVMQNSKKIIEKLLHNKDEKIKKYAFEILKNLD